ncbi:MAG TPA: hypothetical protein VMW50_07570 [Dehalococcoidia bacterium]|nr:hypothetical protein [Dehalococcoidia bacterium]
MTRPSSIPKTFTEAQERSGVSVVIIGSYRTQSNSRFIPYAEIYRSRNSLMETPAEHLQKAAQEDEQYIE